jgi:oligopeptide transport system permease protein
MPEVTATATVAATVTTDGGLAGDAWRDLRRRPLFWLATLVVLGFVAMALVPRLFTAVNPRD